MIGGAPVTESFYKDIGADGYAEDAISVVDFAFRLIDAPALQTTGQEKSQCIHDILPFEIQINLKHNNRRYK